jgi:tRNA(Arg) A34 adenosine deaminase TadA
MATERRKKKMIDRQFIAEAIRLAGEKMAAGEGGPFGALIVRDGAIIARGWNKVTSSNDPTAHAEIVAIRNACSTMQSFDLSGCELFVNCEPCPMCLAAAYWARLSRIVYGADHNDAATIGFADAFIYQELALQPTDRKLVTQQLMAQEARQGLSRWLDLEDKILY